MEFKILGPLEVHDSSGRKLRLPAGRERVLLIALLLRRGEVVSVDALIDALWGEHSPSTAAKAVQGYVSHLRRVLGAESGGPDGVLATQAPGYVLRVNEAQVDAARFEKLAAEGRRALEDGASAEALAMLDSALALWRGPPLAEFTFDDFAQRDIHRLTELQLEASEDRIDALLQLGRHADLVPELESLVTAHPEREHLRGQLMLVLYRSGRQADALRVYRDGRRLANELGLDPSPELRRLERAILDHDPVIAAPPRAPAYTEERDRLGELPLPDEPASGPRRPKRRRWAVVAALAAAALAASVVAIVLARVRDGPSSVAVVPPAVTVVDPATNRVVASIRVGSKPVTIAEGAGSVWVGDARDGTVTRIDPATYTTKAIGIGAPAIDVAVGAGGVWVATGGFGEIVRVDTELDSVADRIELGTPGDPVVPAISSVGAGAEGVWVGTFDGLVRIDPRSGRETERVDLGSTPALQIALGGGAVWSSTIASRAKRVEARSAEVTAEFYAGVSVFPIAVADDGVWVGGAAWTGAEQGQVWKVHPVTGSQELSTRVAAWPAGIEVGAGAVWVTLPGLEELLRIDPETGEILATIPVGGQPEEVVVAGERVWVTVLPSETES